jgi:hypothetical protein
LLAANQSLVLFPEVSALGDGCNLLNENAVEHACLFFEPVSIGFFLLGEVNLRNLSEKFNGLESGTGWHDQISEDVFDEFSLEDVSRWNPRQEDLEGLQALSDQSLLDIARVLDGFVDNKLAQLEDY